MSDIESLGSPLADGSTSRQATFLRTLLLELGEAGLAEQPSVKALTLLGVHVLAALADSRDTTRRLTDENFVLRHALAAVSKEPV